MLLSVALIAAVIGAGAWFVNKPTTVDLSINKPSKDDRYIEAIDEASGLSAFPTERAAVLYAKSLCETIDASGDPKGGVLESIGVDFYCPQWTESFRLLETATIQGTFDVIDIDEYLYSSSGSSCKGEGGYGDINTTTQVIVTNSKGDAITRTELGQGSVVGSSCHYTFSFKVTEGEDLYVVAVGKRGESSYSFDELKEGPALSLG